MKTKRYVTDRALGKRYGVSRATPWNWAKKGGFPKPKKIGPNTTRWDLDEVEEFEANQGAK
jgi:prophage regulatory protein